MKTIALVGKNGSGRFTVVDDDVYQWASGVEWFVVCGYACNRNKEYLHRLIRPVSRPLEVDHKNQDRLDNRRENLIASTHRANIRNSRRSNKHRYALSDYKLVNRRRIGYER